ncbi:putative metal-binding motif-containing protein [Candidatus Pacearchaeota archaeon]|nr:putative metal-binding motif-containing protein [Candidatus Pacearchaeota archaeon]
MGERGGLGKKSFQFVLIASIIIILSLSIVSASFFGNLLKSLGIGRAPTATGYAGSTTSNCFDSDGKNNFDVSGYIDVSGLQRQYDFCLDSSNAVDWFCCDPDVDPECSAGGGDPPAALILPLTGKAIDNQVGKSTTKNCATTPNPFCLSGVCVACVSGSPCGPEQGNTGECNMGQSVCSNGTYSSCSGAVYPVGEICDNKDNDCDGLIDEDGVCGGGGCPDIDADRYTTEANPTTCNNDCNGLTCLGGSDCNDNSSLINPGRQEICGDGIDNDCNPATSDTCPVSCTPATCSSLGKQCGTWANGTTNACAGSLNCGSCQSGYSCNATGQCINNCGNGVCDIGETSSSCSADCQPTTCTYSCGTKNCGTVADSCGAQRSCGTCNSGYSCDTNQVCQSTCVDADGDSYMKYDAALCPTGKDCNDNSIGINPGATELCDAIDQDCDGNPTNDVTIQICGPTGVSFANTSICKQGTKSCSSAGSFGQCLGAVEPEEEICDDDIDNDCDGSIDEGCGCAEGETKSCDSGEICKEGEQACVDGEWGVCEIKGDVAGCNVNTACTSGVLEICGSNVGECQVGSRVCSLGGEWGACDNKEPEEELCDGLDNDCDGNVDEDCGSSRRAEELGSWDIITGEDETSGEEEQTPVAGKEKSFWEILWEILSKIINVARILLGQSGAITEGITKFEEPAKCADADGGISYLVKGSGKGFTQDNVEIWFQDFCYENEMNNQMETCAGDDCYLAEKYCDGNKVKTEMKVTCEFGCADGACIPTAGDSEACQPYFDRDLWEWISPCG